LPRETHNKYQKFQIYSTLPQHAPRRLPRSNSAALDYSTYLLLTPRFPFSFVFNDQTRPGWALRNDAFWAPELHQIGNRFYCYFTARDSNNNALAVGVAVADNILGPYQATGGPLVSNPSELHFSKG